MGAESPTHDAAMTTAGKLCEHEASNPKASKSNDNRRQAANSHSCGSDGADTYAPCRIVYTWTKSAESKFENNQLKSPWTKRVTTEAGSVNDDRRS